MPWALSATAILGALSVFGIFVLPFWVIILPVILILAFRLIRFLAIATFVVAVLSILAKFNAIAPFDLVAEKLAAERV